MNFINLRNVANQEINESFSGILRISPNEKDGISLDDPSPLLYSIGEKIDLSDSAGNYLNISFIPQVYKTFVVGLEGESYANIINLTQKVSDLYCTSELHISPTLHIDLSEADATKAPIQIINENGILLFPLEAPIDDRYINYNSKLGVKPIKNILDDLSAEDEIYTSPEYEDYHIKVNGKKIYRLKKASSLSYPGDNEKEINGAAMVPELYMHDYVLGQSAGHTYRPSLDEITGENKNSRISSLPDKIRNKFEKDNTSRVTQLSFIEIEKLIWSLLEGSIDGAYRSFDGRYKSLYPLGMFADSQGTEDNLYNELFKPTDNTEIDEEELENKIRANAPLVGLPVQSGLIMYNAIPARRFLFHTLRRYENLTTINSKDIPELYPKHGANLFVVSKDEEIEAERKKIRNSYITKSNADNTSSFIHNLTTEYVLCDGKRIKAETEEKEIITDYPSINKKSANWSQYNSNIYNAISSSMRLNNNTLRTPRLFELNQLSLRFLRGLNWQRVLKYDRIVTEGLEDKTEEKRYFDQENMVIEQDGTFVINDWFDPNSDERPEVIKGSMQYIFENNNAKYCLPGLPKNDPANIVKNFAEVGVYYANYDYHLASTYRHVHQVVANKNLLKNGDTLNNVKSYYDGSKNIFATNQEQNTSWYDYVKLKKETYLGSYVMRSVQDTNITDKNLIREIQDLPIAIQGGSSSSMRKVRSSHKGARKHDPRCHGNYNRGENFYNTDGGYRLAAYRPSNSKEGWRFLSSLPAGMNKYGSYKDVNDLATATFNGQEISIDDSLPNPPSISLIPLMKI